MANPNNKIRIGKICQWCNSSFLVILYRDKTAKFCSRKCWLSFQKRDSKEISCVVCNKLHYRPPSYITNIPTCSLKCRGLAMRSSAPSDGADLPSVRGWMKRNGKIQKCSDCGYDSIKEILVIHHINRDRTNNKLENLKVLCPNCHAIEHYFENKNGWSHKSTKRDRIYASRKK